LVVGGWWLVVGGWWLVVGGWWLVVGGWWLVVGGWWLVVGGWWLVVGDFSNIARAIERCPNLGLATVEICTHAGYIPQSFPTKCARFPEANCPH